MLSWSFTTDKTVQNPVFIKIQRNFIAARNIQVQKVTDILENFAPGNFYHTGKTSSVAFAQDMHPLFRIILQLEGNFTYTICRKDEIRDIHLKPGDILFCSRQGTTRPHISDSDMLMYTVSFFPGFIRFLLTRNARNASGQWHLQNHWYHTGTPLDAAGWNMVHALDELCRTQELRPCYTGLAKFILSHCNDLLQQSAVTPNSGKAFQTYQHICAYMTENFTAAITRESVAEEMRLNPSHISKLFRQFSELSFNQMLRKLRMEWAMELLQEKNWTIKEIADQCGYSSVDYFIESFKQYYGQTPGRLRQ